MFVTASIKARVPKAYYVLLVKVNIILHLQGYLLYSLYIATMHVLVQVLSIFFSSWMILIINITAANSSKILL